MNKNLILTMLACLNCVHTTHAGESKPVEIQQDNEDLIKRRIQLANLRCDVGQRYKNLDMVLEGMKQKAKGYWEWDTHTINLMKDNQDPLLQSWLEARQKVVLCIEEQDWKPQDIRRFDQEFMPDWQNFMLGQVDEKLSKRIQRGEMVIMQRDEMVIQLGEMGDLELIQLGEMGNLEDQRPALTAMYRKYPQLRRDAGSPLYCPQRGFIYPTEEMSPVQWAQMFDEYMQQIEKYPDIEQQAWDLNEMQWMYELNRCYILKNNLPDDLGNILESLRLSGSKAGYHFTVAVLRRIHQNLKLDEDKPLYQRTVMALKKDKDLNNLVSNYIQQEKMSLLKTMKHKEKISGPLKQLSDPVFRAVGKYLGTQDSSNKPILGKRTRSDREVDHGPAKRQRTD